jgi:uracil phosphoribosyltransferase
MGDTDKTNGSHEFGPNVHISSHPVLSHKITQLRSSATLPSTFRAVLREVTYHLGYEATKGLTTKPVEITVTVPKKKDKHVSCEGSKLVERVAMIPILRSGLGMTDSMLELLPNSAVHHIGMYRTDQHPVQYYNRLPQKCEVDVAYVLDPLIATAATVMSLVKILKKVSHAHCTLCTVLPVFNSFILTFLCCCYAML